MLKTSVCDVAVVGGGLVGTSFALALAAADVNVLLIDAAPSAPAPDPRSWDSRIYTFSPGNVEWLQALGVWGILPAERLTRVEAMQIYGDDAGGRLEFSAYDAGLRELAWVAENRLVQHALAAAVGESSHVAVRQGARCVDVEWEHESARLTLSDGSEVRARLVVGADGADSWVRERAGISARVHDYGELGVVANFRAERRHDGTAFQWFLADGVLAFLPLPDDCVSIVWSTPEQHARDLLGYAPDALCASVGAASGAVLGRLELMTPPAAFRLKRMRVASLVEPRVALIGDAAHTVHPLAGQGVNLGLRDARALVSVLTERGVQPDCGDYRLLRRYARARAEDILALELTTDGLQKLFRRDAVWLARARNMGLALVDRQAPLKNLLVRHAIG